MKQTRKQQQLKTNFVLVDSELLQTNKEVERAYTLIVEKAIDLLRKFDLGKFRTYCQLDHSKNEQNANLVKEFISYFHNVTLSISPKDGRAYIFIDLGAEALSKFGNGLTNFLLRFAYQITQSNDNTIGIEYALRVSFQPAEQLHNIYYRYVAFGESNYVSINTVEKSTEAN